MASRCAYASLVQRDATGPAEHSVIIGWVWLRCLLPFGCMSIFLSYSGSALCSSTTCAARMAALGQASLLPILHISRLSSKAYPQSAIGRACLQ